MGKSAAKKQIEAGQAEKEKYQKLIEDFSYDQEQFKEGLENSYSHATNPFENLKNPFANQQVGLKGAQVEREAGQEDLANILDSQLQGGGGAAQNATALAASAAQSNQRISAGIQEQEIANQQRAAQGQLQVDQLIGSGEQRRQELIGQGGQYVSGLSEARRVAELKGLSVKEAASQQTINKGYENKQKNKAAWLGLVGDVVKAAPDAINAIKG